MSGLCLATALLLTSLFYGNASDVKFTKKTLNSTAILMNCNYRLGKSEYFSSLNITKDKRLFYSLDNSTVNCKYRTNNTEGYLARLNRIYDGHMILMKSVILPIIENHKLTRLGSRL